MPQVNLMRYLDVGQKPKRTGIRVKTGPLFIICLACLFILLCACEGPKTSWSAESRSPDNKWIARARVIEPSGIGTGNIGTFVDLNWTSGSQKPMTILAFDDGSDYPGDKTVELKWLNPTHLEVAYKGQRTIDFEASVCHGVEITIQQLAK